MNTGKSFMAAAGLIGLALTTTQVHAADLLPAVVTNLQGTLMVDQQVPCNTAKFGTSVKSGRIELTPAEGIDVTGGKQFVLTAASLSFLGFSITDTCLGYSQTQTYSDVGVRLVNSVPFFASLVSPGVYSVTIPKTAIQFYEASIVNNAAANGYLQPSQDVTGTIDLTNGTVSLHVVVTTSITFQIGPINQTDPGTLTTDVSGKIAFPDTDGDGVPDRTDNCRFVSNPTQAVVATPVITAPDLTVATCASQNAGLAYAADVCDGKPVTLTGNAPSTFSSGPNTITWTATDQKNRTTTAVQIVTVVDTTPPVFTSVPADMNVNTCGPLSLGTPNATDDCAGTVTFTNNAPSSFYVGTTPVIWTATDASGNHATATQTVTVVDTTPPTVSCTPVRDPGNSYQVAAADACGAATIALGGFALANSEIVKIVETAQPGVHLIGTVGPNHIRFFQVGKGEAIITATDASNNAATAVCAK